MNKRFLYKIISLINSCKKSPLSRTDFSSFSKQNNFTVDAKNSNIFIDKAIKNMKHTENIKNKRNSEIFNYKQWKLLYVEFKIIFTKISTADCQLIVKNSICMSKLLCARVRSRSIVVLFCFFKLKYFSFIIFLIVEFYWEIVTNSINC